MVDNSSHPGENNTVPRRKVLKTVGITGTVGLAGVGDVAGRSSGDTVKIPELVSDGEIVSYREVPRKWEAHMRNAENANRQVQEQFSDIEGVFSIGLGGAPETYGGKKVSKSQ